MPHAKRLQTLKALISFLTILPLVTFAQTDIKNQIDSLRFTTEVPYTALEMKIEPFNPDTFIYNRGCGDRFLWNAVILKDKAIPYLIELIDDTTETLASFPYQGGQCTVGKMAFIALQEIVHGIPTADLLNVNPEEFDHGVYHTALSKKKNRERFKEAIKQWYDQNRTNLVWVNANSFATCECSGKHPSGGHYEIMK